MAEQHYPIQMIPQYAGFYSKPEKEWQEKENKLKVASASAPTAGNKPASAAKLGAEQPKKEAIQQFETKKQAAAESTHFYHQIRATRKRNAAQEQEDDKLKKEKLRKLVENAQTANNNDVLTLYAKKARENGWDDIVESIEQHILITKLKIEKQDAALALSRSWNALDSRSRVNSLKLAILNNNIESVRMITTDYFDKIDFAYKNSKGRTLIEIAQSLQRTEAEALLRQAHTRQMESLASAALPAMPTAGDKGDNKAVDRQAHIASVPSDVVTHEDQRVGAGAPLAATAEVPKPVENAASASAPTAGSKPAVPQEQQAAYDKSDRKAADRSNGAGTSATHAASPVQNSVTSPGATAGGGTNSVGTVYMLLRGLNFDPNAAAAYKHENDFSKAAVTAFEHGHEKVFDAIFSKQAPQQSDTIARSIVDLLAQRINGAHSQHVVSFLKKVHKYTIVKLFFAAQQPELVNFLLHNKLVAVDEDLDGWTRLMRAARDGNNELVTCLIDAKANVLGKGGVNSWTPLLYALQSDVDSQIKLNMAQTLIKAGSNPCVTCVNALEETSALDLISSNDPQLRKLVVTAQKDWQRDLEQMALSHARN